jgi:thiol-disulfide isomerase/thioredoxin
VKNYIKSRLSSISCLGFVTSFAIAQPISYVFHLNETYDLASISEVKDPYQHTLDTIWKNGDAADPTSIFEDSVGHYISLFRDDLSIDAGYRLSHRSVTTLNDGFTEYKPVFESIERMQIWMYEHLGNKHDRIYYKRSKGARKKMNSFLQTPNDSIIGACGVDTASLSVSDRDIVDRWLWVRKLSLYLYDTTSLDDLLIEYERTIDSESDLAITIALLTHLRFIGYVALLRDFGAFASLVSMYRERIETAERKYLPLFQYASLLYCLKKQYNFSNVIYTGSHRTIAYIEIDTTLLSSYDVPEIQYVLALYRSPIAAVDLSYQALNISGQRMRLSDTITTNICVIEFWGTWCKPCVDNMPIVDDLARKYADQVQFISIARENEKGWSKFLQAHNYHSIIHLLADQSLSLLYSPGVNILPTYLIIDNNGLPLHRPINYIGEMVDALAELTVSSKE